MVGDGMNSSGRIGSDRDSEKLQASCSRRNPAARKTEERREKASVLALELVVATEVRSTRGGGKGSREFSVARESAGSAGRSSRTGTEPGGLQFAVWQSRYGSGVAKGGREKKEKMMTCPITKARNSQAFVLVLDGGQPRVLS